MLRTPSARRRALEAGQILPMSLMLLALFIGFAGIVVDVGFFLHRKDKVQAVMDAAALAGAQELPDDLIAAEDKAREWADRNGLDGNTIDVDFECNAVNPADCQPSGFDTITVSGSMKAPVTLMRVLRLLGGGGSCWTDDGCDVQGHAAAEALPGGSEVDVVLIMDRTGSMSGTPLARAKSGAFAMLYALDPQLQHVGLAVLPPSRSQLFTDSDTDGIDDVCQSRNSNPPGTSGQWGVWPDNWLVVGLSDDYQNPGGSLNTSSRLVRVTNCLNDDGATNIAYPIRAAREHLQTAGRPGVTQVIILLTDGAANRPCAPAGWSGPFSCPDPGDPNSLGTNPCAEANAQATIAKNAGIEIYTIAYGIESDDICREDDAGTTWRNVSGRVLARAIATDDDHFYDEPADSDLTDEFRQIAGNLGAGFRLVD